MSRHRFGSLTRLPSPYTPRSASRPFEAYLLFSLALKGEARAKYLTENSHVTLPGKAAPVLNFKYPLELGDAVDDCKIEQLSKLCFPFTDTAAIATKSHFFTFTFTRGDGSLRYGFCLQLEPPTPASDAVLHCIITGLPWFTFFHDVLKVVASLNSSSKVW